jgi:hypothetical protein
MHSRLRCRLWRIFTRQRENAMASKTGMSINADEENLTSHQSWIDQLAARYPQLSQQEIAKVIKEVGPARITIEAELERRSALIDQDSFNFPG